MKILYVITKANWGGAQKYVYELALGAKAAGHDVAVAYGESGELERRLAAAGIRALAVPALSRDVGIARELRAWHALRSLFKAERPDVVHLNSSKAGALGALAARLAHVPRIVFTSHGWAFNEARPWWQRLIIYKLVWFTVALSHKTICVSHAVKRDVAWMPGIRTKLVVIPLGVEAPVYKGREEARSVLWRGHEGGVWIGMLSELHPTKRVDDAIEAFALLRESCPETRLLVLGEGEEREKLQELIGQKHLEGYARLPGLVPGGDAYLKAFDIFLHASRSEALGLALIEAGFAALPVVATNVGGVPEIVEDGVTGLLVEPYEPEDMAEALKEVAEDTAYAKELGEALRTSVRERFNPARMMEQTLSLYSLNRPDTH